MDNNSLRIITSERGKELAVLSNYKYRFVRTRRDGLIKWSCSNKNCSASILTDANKSHVNKIISRHNHENNTAQQIERQVLRESCKRRATDSILTRPSKIINKELLKSVSTELVSKDITSVRKAMYIERRKHITSYPQSFIETIDKLHQMENDDFLNFANKQFVHTTLNKSIVCITTEQNLNFMCSCTEYFVDSTIQKAPKFFLQMYTIHCFKNGFYVPVIYIFLKEKLKQTYIEMWQFIRELYEKYTTQKFSLCKLHVDLEIEIHEAIKEIFPNVQIIECRFHLRQAWWRYINTNTELKTVYSDDRKIL